MAHAMRVALTGGGTGGHIYPAVEVGRAAAERGAEILYLGSMRGQEGRICDSLGIPFQGFVSEPLWSLRTPSGWRALARMIRSSLQAKQYLVAANVDVVFSTGGYSAAPVVLAAKRARIPYVIHEANSIPGRVNRMFAPSASSITCAFFATQTALPKARRTGQPIRAALRAAALDTERRGQTHILVTGGSQGSAFLNRLLPETAKALAAPRSFLHVTGRANLDKVTAPFEGYQVVPYLETAEMTAALAQSLLVVSRSGGFLAELALFGLPSVLVPLPTSADDHQLHNAKEFADMGAAVIVPESEASPQRLAAAIQGWIDNPQAQARAQAALRAWDAPDATDQIVGTIFEAVRSGRRNS